jgi:hypothetical protein
MATDDDPGRQGALEAARMMPPPLPPRATAAALPTLFPLRRAGPAVGAAAGPAGADAGVRATNDDAQVSKL